MKLQYTTIIVLIAFIAFGCADREQDNAPETGENGIMNGQMNGSRQIQGRTGVKPPEREPMIGRLEQMKEHFYLTADPQTAETVNLAIDEIRTFGIEQSSLSIGDHIPMFTLPDATGKMVSSKELLEKGPIVIMWYRGPWCPYCNLQLREMQEYLPFIHDIGASLVAISPTMPDSSLSMKERLGLGYHVLTDSGNVVANQFGLMYKMPKKYKAMLEKKHNFKKYYGNNSGELPLTTTYVVNQDGEVRYSFGDSDYRMRAEPQEIMDVLMRIKEGENKEVRSPLQ